jgi:hypothetical protein
LSSDICLKFGVVDAEHEAYRYAHLYQRDRTSTGGDRLRIGPRGNHVALLTQLSKCLPGPLRLLYVLIVPRNGEHDAGRYEAASELSHDEVSEFLDEFSVFLESDGRHHLWIASPEFGTLVYDRHDLIYAYGPLDWYVEILEANRLQAGNVEISGPHWHAYHQTFDKSESRLLSRMEWIHSPLRESDD